MKIFLSTLLLLLLVLVPEVGGAIDSLRPVWLTIRERSHVKLLVGNPGQYVQFRLNFSLSEILLHSTLLSSTEATGPSDLFYLGEYALRLPFRYAADPAASGVTALAFGSGFGGTLGLGRYSPLWKYWRSASFSPTSILLGSYDRYAQLDPEQSPLVLPHGTATVSVGNFSAELVLEPGALDSFLPGPLFESPPETLTVIGSPTQQQLVFDSHEVWLQTQQHYRALQRSYDGRIHVGKRFLDNYLFHCDWNSDVTQLSLSVFSFTETDFDAFCSLVLIMLIGVWLTLALGRPTDEWLFQLLLFVELYTYLFSAMVTVVNFYGMHWSRYISHFLKASSFVPSLVLLYCLLSAIVFGSAIVLRNVRLPSLARLADKQRHSENLERAARFLNLRAFCFLSAANFALWQALLQDHKTSTDLVYLLLTLSILAVVSGTLTLFSLWRYRRLSLFMTLNTLLCYWFLIRCTLVPCLREFNFHENTFLAVMFYFSGLILFPTYITLARVVLGSLAPSSTRTASAC